MFGLTWGSCWENHKSQFHPTLVMSWEVVPITQSRFLIGNFLTPNVVPNWILAGAKVNPT